MSRWNAEHGASASVIAVTPLCCANGTVCVLVGENATVFDAGVVLVAAVFVGCFRVGRLFEPTLELTGKPVEDSGVVELEPGTDAVGVCGRWFDSTESEASLPFDLGDEASGEVRACDGVDEEVFAVMPNRNVSLVDAGEGVDDVLSLGFRGFESASGLAAVEIERRRVGRTRPAQGSAVSVHTVRRTHPANSADNALGGLLR